MVNVPQKQFPIPILARSAWWFTLSLVLLGLTVGKLAYNRAAHGEALSYGVDFSGGAAYVVQFDKLPGRTAPETIRIVRETLEPLNLPRPSIQVFSGGGQVQIHTQTGASARSTATASSDMAKEAAGIEQALEAKHGQVTMLQQELVGPVIGEMLRRNGLLAVILGCLVILLYVWIRYNIGGLGGGFLFGLCAIIALIHDSMVMVGGFAWTGTEVNTNFIAAILTIIGFSVNDTVVIYDRIRENLRAMDPAQRRNRAHIDYLLEASVWQTMGRSLITAFATILPLITLFIFGGSTLRDFALAMIFGIISGSYSTIFIATPLWSWLYRRSLIKKGELAPAGTPRPTAAQRPRATEPAATRPTPTQRPVPAKPATTAPSSSDAATTSTPATTTEESVDRPRPAGGSRGGKRGKTKRRY